MNAISRAGALLLCAALPLHTLACDACGCSVAGPAALGLLPTTKGHFAAASFQYQSFSAGNTTQHYTSLQAWGRFSAGRRLQLYGYIPYRINQVADADGAVQKSSGLGDVSLLAQTVVLRREKTETRAGQVLLAGVGIKAPTGRHLAAPDEQGLPNSQPGTGAWDGQLAASYTFNGRKVGFNAEASYVLTTANAFDYKYGNRLGAGLSAFLQSRTGDLEWLPMAGVRYEYLLHDYTRYARRWLDRSTGGSVLYAQAGVQVYRKKLGFSALCLVPLVQSPAGNLRAHPRLDGGLTFFF